jgi:Tol biopolymer transport system component
MVGDGQQIALDARPEGHSHIYILPAGEGLLKESTFGDANDILPRWSADGHSIYFTPITAISGKYWKVDLLYQER